MLATLVDSLGHSSTASGIKLGSSCLLAFAPFLRMDELDMLWCCDIRISKPSMSVHKASNKIDQYRQGDSFIVKRTGS